MATKVFFDIETASIPCELLDENQMRVLENLYRSKLKSVQLKKGSVHYMDTKSELARPLVNSFLNQNGSFHAILSKLLCVTMGWVNEEKQFVTHTMRGEEKDILDQLKKAFDRDYLLVGHNILGFDIPYLQHKYMQYQVKIPKSLQLCGIKPRDMKHQDTMKIYRGGEFQNTSLENLCLTLGVETPKEGEIHGGNIAAKYKEVVGTDKLDAFLDKVVQYCEQDVKATYDCYVKIANVLDVK